MKIFSILLLTILATVALSKFVPVSNYNLNLLKGTWNVQSIYDTVGNDWSLSYCFQLTFTILNSSAVNMTSSFFDGFNDIYRNDNLTLYPDASNPSVLYQDTARQNAPLVVLNTSSLPYWVDNTSNTTVFAFNYTVDSSNPQYIVFGASRWYDTAYDVSPFVKSNNLPINATKNFWFVNTACDTHYGWSPLKTFHQSSLLGNWNLLGVYDPVGSDIVPWYTEGGIFNWNQAYCGQVSFQPGTHGSDWIMNLTLDSLYQGGLERTWRIVPYPQMNSVLFGFNINENTLLYVQYADFAGNLILTAGTTTSFFLSTSATSLTPVNRGIFEVALRAVGWNVDLDYVYAIDNNSC